MRLSTSTGDFAHYYPHIADYIREFRGLKFKYINLEQCGDDFPCGIDVDYVRVAEEWGSAAEEAGVTFVISHAPCVNAFAELTEEHYATCLRAVRRSIEICGRLGIPRLVVHASKSEA